MNLLANFQWYRKLRGGRWTLMTGLFWGKSWVRAPKECVEYCEEDWTR